MAIIIIAIWGLIFGLYFIAPSLSLLLYGLVGADRDGYGVLSAMSLVMPDHKLVTRGFFFGLYCFSSFVFCRRIKEFRPEIKFYIYSAQLLALFIFIGSLAKGFDIIKSISVLVYSGLPTYVCWIVFSLKKSNSMQFYLYVFFQNLIALSVIIIPSLDFLNGATYKELEGFSVINDSIVNSSLPTASVNKNAIGKYGCFHNPNALGFYACAAIAIGLGLLKTKYLNLRIIIFIVSLCLIGIFCWLNSLTRGPMLMLIVGVVSAKVLFKSRTTEGRFLVQTCLAFIIFIATIMSGIVIDVFSYLIPDSSNISVTARFEGYVDGLEAIYLNPLWGVHPEAWSEWKRPHLLPLAFAADHGIFAGVMITLIIFGGGSRVLFLAFKYSYLHATNGANIALAIYFIMLVWGAALSNNLISPILFWICFAEANIKVLGVRNLHHKSYIKLINNK